MSSANQCTNRGERVDAIDDCRVRSLTSSYVGGYNSLPNLSLFLSSSAPRLIPKNPDYSFMEHLLKELQGHSQAWAFLKPVNGDEVPDYYDVIKNPMGMSVCSCSWLFLHFLYTFPYPLVFHNYLTHSFANINTNPILPSTLM